MTALYRIFYMWRQHSNNKASRSRCQLQLASFICGGEHSNNKKKYSINLLCKNAINYNIVKSKIKIKLVIIIYE
ncbi:hypothetical protein DQ06_10530 [Brachyspira hampsonii bv. II]|nr:hypothetical protein DQ06_10530 [Brachyspira hampsonii bv. II]